MWLKLPPAVDMWPLAQSCGSADHCTPDARLTRWCHEAKKYRLCLNLNKIRAGSVWHHRRGLRVFWPGELTCQVLENVWWRKYQQWNPPTAALCVVAVTWGGNIILEANVCPLIITFSRMSPLFALEQSHSIICMPHNRVTLFYPTEKCIIYYTFRSTKAFKVIAFRCF